MNGTIIIGYKCAWVINVRGMQWQMKKTESWWTTNLATVPKDSWDLLLVCLSASSNDRESCGC